MLDYGREICGNEAVATSREWLVTNGIGGFASGTITGINTRRYHGLLIAALQPPLGRTLLVSTLRPTVSFGAGRADAEYALWSGEVKAQAGAVLRASGHTRLQRFHLEGTTPVWTYAVEDALIEQRLWMPYGINATYITFRLTRGTRPLLLGASLQVNHRDMHHEMRAPFPVLEIASSAQGVTVKPYRAKSFFLLSDTTQIRPVDVKQWERSVDYPVEIGRGLNPRDYHLTAATLSAQLEPDQTVTVIFTTDPNLPFDGDAAYAAHRQREDALIVRSPLRDEPAWIRQLVRAADQFIVRRAVEDDPDGRTIIAGYHWFSDWGRDTMIALPGLTLATGRTDDAAKILRTFARFVSRGMLPNRFPDSGQAPEYNTVDATLWYFEAIRAYHAATGDDALLRELYPTLRDIVGWHIRGTRYGIGVDAADGLLRAGEPGVQLTWMDVKIGEWVVTPRHGKPVEINALWYNALRSMAEFARHLGEGDAERFDAMADVVRASFGRFWNAERGCLYDVIDTPDGDDPSVRPNQLFAVSLHHPVLSGDRARAIVDVCARRLLTSLGLRSLSPDDPRYLGQHTGGPETRDATYHQGTVWAWLIGPFISAHYRVYRDKTAALRFLDPFRHHLDDGCVGTIAECAHGDPPHAPTAAVAQAWSVGEVLRVWAMLAREL